MTVAAPTCPLFYTKLCQGRLTKQRLPRQRYEARRSRHRCGAPKISDREFSEQQTPQKFAQYVIEKRRHRRSRPSGRT